MDNKIEKWLEYEEEKKKLKQDLSSKEYTEAIQAICKRLKI